jgi:hypothetical protein
MKRELSAAEMKAFEPEAKIGLLATVSPEGLPHLTLISSIQAKSPTQLMWGQFCEGLSKEHVKDRAEVAFLVMSLDRQLWRGTARWTHAATEGEDYVRFNQLPMFRYNSYFGIHTVHYMDLVEHTGRRDVFLAGAVAGAVASLGAGVVARVGRGATEPGPMNFWTMHHLQDPSTLKFVAWITTSGFPEILPLVPACPAGPDRLVLGPRAPAIPAGSPVAVFALNLQMESVLVRGTLARARRAAVATVDVEWVYNSMPPLPGQVFPPVPLEPVRDFAVTPRRRRTAGRPAARPAR